MKVICDAWSTDKAMKFLRMFNLKDVREVKLDRKASGSGGDVDVIFIFKNEDEITVRYGFSTGYGGTGPWGLHDILIECGFSEQTAKSAFTLTLKGAVTFKK